MHALYLTTVLRLFFKHSLYACGYFASVGDPVGENEWIEKPLPECCYFQVIIVYRRKHIYWSYWNEYSVEYIFISFIDFYQL